MKDPHDHDGGAPRAELAARLRWALGAARLTLRDPRDGVDRLLSRARGLAGGADALSHAYVEDQDWQRSLHGALAAPWPCPYSEQFEELWSRIGELFANKRLTMGRGAYGGWDDGDSELARAAFCLTTHLGAERVVETGVARGVTSRVILEALEGRGRGHLHSIDLPALDNAIHTEIAAAVVPELRGRWSYVTGTSRRRLPQLLAQLGTIDLFVHDSSHTARNLRFELEQAWRAIDRGAILADDIDRNPAFAQFVRARPGHTAIVARAGDRGALFGIVLKQRS